MNIYKVVVEKRIYRLRRYEWQGDYIYWGTAESFMDAVRKCRNRANKDFNYQARIKAAELVGEKEF